MSIQARDDRHMRSLTGMSITHFEILLDKFTITYAEVQRQAYQDGSAAGMRKRRPGGG